MMFTALVPVPDNSSSVSGVSAPFVAALLVLLRRVVTQSVGLNINMMDVAFISDTQAALLSSPLYLLFTSIHPIILLVADFHLFTSSNHPTPTPPPSLPPHLPAVAAHQPS